MHSKRYEFCIQCCATRNDYDLIFFENYYFFVWGKAIACLDDTLKCKKYAANGASYAFTSGSSSQEVV